MGRERKTLIEQDPQVRRDFGRELLQLRVQQGKTQAEWAEAVDIDQSIISTLERATKRQIPPRAAVIDWGMKWGLSWDERAQLLLAGRYIPELPDGFGTNLDRILLAKSLRELFGDIPGDTFSQALIARCTQLLGTQTSI